MLLDYVSHFYALLSICLVYSIIILWYCFLKKILRNDSKKINWFFDITYLIFFIFYINFLTNL